MTKVYSLDGITPVVHPTAYVHPSAVLIGDVIVGQGCYIGPSASLRGDFGRLIVEEGANIQDCCVMHGFPDTDTVVGPNGHIGHGAVIHCCQIGRNAMVGMNAVVMDRAVIGESAVVAACAFIRAGMEVPPRSLAAGVPAKILRELTELELGAKIDGTALYQDLARRSLVTMRETVALPVAEKNRPRMRVAHLKPWVDLKKAGRQNS
jgi:phenylacetic acid degradation protein